MDQSINNDEIIERFSEPTDSLELSIHNDPSVLPTYEDSPRSLSNDDYSESINTDEVLRVGMARQTFDFDDNYEFDYNYELERSYVKEKIDTLNAQLASEPLPPEAEHRNSKVVFKEDIASVLAPADYYDPSESEIDDAASYNADGFDFVTLNDNSNIIPPDDNAVTSNTVTETSIIDKEQTKDGDDRIRNEGNDQSNVLHDSDCKTKSKRDIVISRGGQFEFLSSDEITDDSKGNNRNGTKRNNTPKRSLSAPATRKRDRGLNFDSGGSEYSDSNSRSNSTLEKRNERSKFQIPRVDKDALQRRQERKKREEEENRKREEDKQNMRKEVNDKSFNAWLQTKQRQKKEDDERRKKEEEMEIEKKEIQQEERKHQAQDMEAELAKKLALEKRKEEKLRQYKLKEIADQSHIHTDYECQKAFKSWLKKKQSEHLMKIREEKENARITRLAMRQCRKSQNLAQAIQQSSSLCYRDFCEYP